MRAYIKELEDIISDVLLPGYIENCRSKGIPPKTNKILTRLTQARKLLKEVPMLLRKY
jgi:hypothetical protein